MAKKYLLLVGAVLAVATASFFLIRPAPVPPPPPPPDKTVVEVAGTRNPTRVADVVFVHCLGGDYQGSWHPDGEPEKFWPRWIARDAGEVGVWSIQYDAAPANWNRPRMPLGDRATKVLNQLEAQRVGTERAVVFVAHGLGGILVKEMIKHAATLNDHGWEAILGNTRGVAFLSTPHATADLAPCLDAIFKSVAHEAVADAPAAAAPVHQLNIWYRAFAPVRGIRTLALYEERALNGTLVLTAARAEPGIPGVTARAVEADFRTICKPPSEQNDVYVAVLDFVRQCLNPPAKGP
jgi:hypothetical protein